MLAGGYLNVAVTLAPSGQVILGALETDRPVLKAPLHVAPRPASAMSAAVAVVDFGVTESAQRPIPLAGTALAAGGAPTSTVALLSALELQIVSPRAPEQQNPPTPPRADIKFVGVTSDLQAAGSVADATVAFALVTFGRWNSPLEVLFNVYVDVNGDNSADYIVSNGVAGLYPNDNFVVTVENLATRESAAFGPLNGLQRFEYAVPQLNSDTMILSVPAAALGLGPGRTSFSFFVTTAVRVSDGPSTGDQSARGFHDVARPGLVFTAPFVAFPTLPDRPGESLLARLNSANYTRSNSKGILLIHHHNANSTRVEVVAVKYAWPYNYVFPVAWGPPAP